MTGAVGAVCLVLMVPAFAPGAVERVAVVVGNNEGHDLRRALRYAEADAAKVARALVELGGFSTNGVKLLTAKGAADIRAALSSAEEQVVAARMRGAQTLLLFYYSGHASADTLELGETTLPFVEVTQVLRGSAAHVRLALIDSCESGRLVTGKGARRAAPFPVVQLEGDLRATGYAAITSSADTELSQESSEIRGSFFTHFLVSGLRGAADASGDGRVTLTEAYAYAYGRTVARTSANIAGGQHPMYDFRLSGRGDLVLAEPHRETGRLEVASRSDGRLIVLSADGEQALAEVVLQDQKPMALQLAPGRYRAVFLNATQSVDAHFEVRANTPPRLTTPRSPLPPPSRRWCRAPLHRRYDAGGAAGVHPPLLGRVLHEGLVVAPGERSEIHSQRVCRDQFCVR